MVGAATLRGRSSAWPHNFRKVRFREVDEGTRLAEAKRVIERLPVVSHNGRRTRIRGRSSAWLERLPVTQEVASSTLVGPAFSSKKSITVITT